LLAFWGLSTIKIGQFLHAYSARLRLLISLVPYSKVAIIWRNCAQKNAVVSCLASAIFKRNQWVGKKCSAFACEGEQFDATASTFHLLPNPCVLFSTPRKSSIHDRPPVKKDLTWHEWEDGVFNDLLYKGKRTGISVISGRPELGITHPKHATVFRVCHDKPNKSLELYDAPTLKEGKEFAEKYFSEQIGQENYSTKKKSWLPPESRLPKAGQPRLISLDNRSRIAILCGNVCSIVQHLQESPLCYWPYYPISKRVTR
jgi:hypothetical protein